MGGAALLIFAVTAKPITAGASGSMQRTVESLNPVLGKRTPKLSIALAVTHVLRRRNCSNSAGENRDSITKLLPAGTSGDSREKGSAAQVPTESEICERRWLGER
jgi:hypothetical protein